MGLISSLFVHALVLLILSLMYRWSPSDGELAPVQYEFAILQEEELTQLQETAFDDLVAQGVTEPQIQSTDVEEVPDIPAAEFGFSSSELVAPLVGTGSDEAFAEAIPTLDRSDSGGEVGKTMSPQASPGSGEEPGETTAPRASPGSGKDLGETTGPRGVKPGVSFFGINTHGTRIVYIVDGSGSMNEFSKMDRVRQELLDSINDLPDGVQFFVILFSDHLSYPQFQRGWMKPDKKTLSRMSRWIRLEIRPWGGTEPLPAFHVVFGLDKIGGRPDVIFFLTDGKIKGVSAQDIVDLNDQDRPVQINTIAFGNRSSQGLLKKIASKSGGEYKFVFLKRR